MTQKKPVKSAKSPGRDSKGHFSKGNSIKNTIPPEVKCVRAAIKAEVARATFNLTLGKEEGLENLKNGSILGEILADAVECKKQMIIESFLDRTCGKAPQAIQMDVSRMPDEDLLILAREALKEIE